MLRRGAQVLSKAVAYIQQNELTKWIKIVYVYEDLNDPVIRALADNLRVIDRCYPKVLNVARFYLEMFGLFCLVVRMLGAWWLLWVEAVTGVAVSNDVGLDYRWLWTSCWFKDTLRRPSWRRFRPGSGYRATSCSWCALASVFRMTLVISGVSASSPIRCGAGPRVFHAREECVSKLLNGLGTAGAAGVAVNFH